jgi:site-specific DNA-cytosine methylase
MSITHASIVPLIGGMTLGAEKTFGSRPEYLLSYTPFINNDSHIVAHYDNEVPYYLLDRGEKPNKSVDVINTVCPCAGLSQLSHGFGDHNQNNKWMVETTNYVLNELKPTVFYGENAPGFAGKIGETVRNKIHEIGKLAGYTMTVYRTKSLFHGVSQIRERSFYFFWKGNKTPLLNYYRRERDPIEKVIREAKGNSQRVPINPKIPSRDDPYYRYILEAIHGGLTHSEFTKIIEPANARGNDVLSYIELMGHTYDKVGVWMAANGYEREVDKCNYRLNKIAEGGNLMRRGTVIPRDYIGAFVGHYPTMLTHPDEDRYINYREAMTIMGMPDNFQLLNASRKNVNHICQNVPVQTAADMATEVLAFINNERNLVDNSLVFQYNHGKTHNTVGDTSSNSLENFMGK